MEQRELTNEELIKKLKEFPLDAKIKIVTPGHDGNYETMIDSDTSFELIKRFGGIDLIKIC